MRDKGITESPLHALNPLLQPQGLMIHASKVRDARRSVAYANVYGRVEHYGVFELRTITAR